MVWDPQLKMTPRLAAMLRAEEQRAIARDDGYLGTEHLLEAIIEGEHGLARHLLDKLGVVEQIREELDRFWSSQTIGSLLMVEPGLPLDEFGHPYQALTFSDRPGAPSRLLLGDNGEPMVRAPRAVVDLSDLSRQPAPPAIAEAARRWEARQ
jgi:hypothetical protein